MLILQTPAPVGRQDSEMGPQRDSTATHLTAGPHGHRCGLHVPVFNACLDTQLPQMPGLPARLVETGMRPAARRRGPTQHTCLAPLLTSFSNLKTSRASSHLSCRFAESTKLLPSRAMLMCVQDSPMSRLKRLLVQLSLRRWSVLTFCSTSLRARSGRSSSCTLCRQVKQLSTCRPAAGMNMQQACRRCKGYAASSEWLWQLVKLASGIKIFPELCANACMNNRLPAFTLSTFCTIASLMTSRPVTFQHSHSCGIFSFGDTSAAKCCQKAKNIGTQFVVAIAVQLTMPQTVKARNCSGLSGPQGVF